MTNSKGQTTYFRFDHLLKSRHIQNKNLANMMKYLLDKYEKKSGALFADHFYFAAMKYTIISF